MLEVLLRMRNQQILIAHMLYLYAFIFFLQLHGSLLIQSYPVPVCSIRTIIRG